MNAWLSNDGLIDGSYFARTHIYSDGKQSARAWACLIHAFSLIRTPSLRYALVTYYGARVSSYYVEIAHVRTCARLILWCGYRCVSRGDPSTRSNGLQSSVLLRQLSARRISRPATSSSSSFSAWLIAHVDSERARTHTAVIWRARENGSRTQIGTKLTSRLRFVLRRCDTKIKGPCLGKAGRGANRCRSNGSLGGSLRRTTRQVYLVNCLFQDKIPEHVPRSLA